MALDNLFSGRVDDQKMETEILRFKQVALILGLICMVLTIAFNYLNGQTGPIFFIGVPIIIIFFATMAALALTLFVAMIPYKDFSYHERFLRYFLMVTMFVYGMLNFFWILAIFGISLPK